VERGKLGLGQFPGAFPFFFQILFPKEFWAKHLKIKTETHPKINAILSMNAKACF
jgi:hypothetical protein